MNGYWQNEEASRETMTPDGWVRTGDLAYMSEDGHVFFVDRAKDMIVNGGYNIYPAEVERVIAMYPGVAMVAVGRIADEVKGELPKPYIVPKEKETLTEEDIINTVAST
jgi:long-chain acyl-CoA synthetase